jgi:LmbE family N-acetylglucosaminyl deacetylase
MKSNNFPQPERVLVVVAHPDDPEFGAGGTIARWADAGAEVTFAIVTDGSKGSAEPDMTPERLVALRQEEERAAAAALGVHNVQFLGHEDGRIENTLVFREEIVRLIRTHRPDVLITHDPSSRIMGNTHFNHTDHRAVGDAALDCVYPLARDRLNFPEHEVEGLEPHKVLQIFLTSSNSADYVVDISATMDKKITSLWAHKSQIGDPQELDERIRAGARALAEQVSFEYGERFRRIDMRG